LLGPGLAGLFTRCAARPLIRGYLRTHDVKKLQLGGAGLAGWLNSDLCPNRLSIVRMDATRPFPLPDASFSFVFSEHMIEHVPLAGARRMLAECHRILRPGGRIRLATPDLARVVGIHGATDATTRDYLRWAIAHNRLPTDLPADAVVINSLFHDHGHQFLFDEPTLAALLQSAGFEDVRRYAPGESEQPELAGLEMHHHVIGDAPNHFETLVLEARQP
jgi:predicted SAM-dependent methyltransferase